RLVTCTNMTMAQLADRLPGIASAYLQMPVLDMTGLGGVFDFTFNFSTAGDFQRALRGRGDRGAPAGPPANGTSSASDPSAAISLFDALIKQLGLKLEMQKRPLPVLVIDHAEEKPADN